MKEETSQILVDRWNATSSRPYDEVIAALEAAIGHPETNALLSEAEAASPAEMKAAIERAVGPSGLMEFIRFNPTNILARETNHPPRIQRFVVGNPLIMKEMVKHVPDAASYAPVTILVVEEPDSVRIAYDTMASLLAPYGNAAASQVARDLDEKIKRLITDIAG